MIKDYQINIGISKATSICLKHGIKVYPVINGSKFQIEVDNSGKKTKYKQVLSSNEVNIAMKKTYKHFALKILKEKENANSTNS